MEMLSLLNEWWETGSISREKAKPYKRKVFEVIKKTFFKYRQILILTGLRRVGKSTLMFQLIQELLNKVEPRRIVYFSFDEAVEDPVRILEEYSKITRIDWRKEKVFIFFDEVQKLRGWSSKLKILYDNFPSLKICVSGPASLMIHADAVKNLAGRYFSIHVTPLTLQEFAELYYGKPIDNFNVFESTLKRVFEDYIRKPFPEIVSWQELVRVNDYVRELIIEKIVRSDIPQSFEKVNVSLLSTLTELFMRDVGMVLDISALSKEFGVRKLTLSEHVKLLEFSGLIRIVRNYRPSVRAESRKLRKVYPMHIALSFSYYPDLDKGQVFESLVCSSLGLKNYWRKTGREVDFLKINREITPIEVKAKEKLNKQDVKNILYFMENYGVKQGIIVYLGREGVLNVKNKKIKLVPIHKLVFKFTLN